eukprot:Rhum_TRINITY_DN14221_c21_g1::Rhum_TRINITY_DN14221_c21_g1_i1::g.74949::m.74949
MDGSESQAKASCREDSLKVGAGVCVYLIVGVVAVVMNWGWVSKRKGTVWGVGVGGSTRSPPSTHIRVALHGILSADAAEQVLHSEHQGKDDAECADGDVDCSEEDVASADPRQRGEDDVLLAGEPADVEAVVNLQLVRPRRQRPPLLRDLAVQLTERGQRRGTHPHHEVLVRGLGHGVIGLEQVPPVVQVGQQRQVLALHPRFALAAADAVVHLLAETVAREDVDAGGRGLELLVAVGIPRDALLCALAGGWVGSVADHLPRRVTEHEAVVELRPGNQAAGRIRVVVNRAHPLAGLEAPSVASDVPTVSPLAVNDRDVRATGTEVRPAPTHAARLLDRRTLLDFGAGGLGTGQLGVASRLGVAPVVLVEGCELVVHVDGWLHSFGNHDVYRRLALRVARLQSLKHVGGVVCGLVELARAGSAQAADHAALLRAHARGVLAEVKAVEGGALLHPGAPLDALYVVVADLNLLDVVARHDDQRTDGDEGGGHEEEAADHPLRRQDGLPCPQALLLERGVGRLPALWGRARHPGNNPAGLRLLPLVCL